MRRSFPPLALCLCALLFWTPSAPARDLDPRSLDVDQKGALPREHIYTVKSVEDETTALVRVYRVPSVAGRPPEPIGSFLLKCPSTRTWADGKDLDLKGEYRVSGTLKLRGMTLYVLEPVK